MFFKSNYFRVGVCVIMLQTAQAMCLNIPSWKNCVTKMENVVSFAYVTLDSTQIWRIFYAAMFYVLANNYTELDIHAITYD